MKIDIRRDDDTAAGLTEAIGWTSRTLERIGTLRDGILVALALIYALGYSVWAVNALARHLGPVPAIQTQYFVAGIVPFMLSCFVFIALQRLRQKLRLHDRWHSEEGLLGLRKVQIGMFVASTAVLGLGTGTAWFEAQKSNQTPMLMPWFIPPWLMIVYSLRLYGELMREAIQGSPSTVERYLTSARYVMGWSATGICGLLIILYVTVAYGSIPQELGGMRPRSAYVDIDRAAFSTQVLAVLAPNALLNDTQRVIRSDKLHVLYTTDDAVVISNPNADSKSLNTTIELKRTTIKSITWCP